MKIIATILALVATGAFAGLHVTPFRVELKKTEDTAAITSTRDSTIVNISSKSGIGEARLIRNDHPWPTRLTIRLAVKGLESFRMENGIIYFNTSLNGPKRVPYWKFGKNEKQPDAPGGTLEIALRKAEDSVEIVVHAKLMAGNPREIKFGWIDFFRD